MMTENVYAELGSVSWGTLRNEDLIPRFMETLHELWEQMIRARVSPGQEKEFSKRISHLDDVMGDIERRMEGENYYQSKNSDWDVETLICELDNFAPPYSYFGCSEGDGADFGFWISWDSVGEAIEDGAIMDISEQEEWPEDEISERPGVEYVIDGMSKYGGGTLYAPKFPGACKKEDWEIVWSV